MSIIHVSLSFTASTDPELDAFTENVIAKLTGNLSFPTPPVTLSDLQGALSNFTDALAAAAQGGKQATAAKNNAREVLVTDMRKIANYVQVTSNDDLAVLLSSGFQSTDPNRAQSPLPQPVIQKVLNEVSTQLLVRVLPLDNARAYVLRYSDDSGVTWKNGITSTKAQRIVVPNLTPGKIYTLEVQAIGGSTGYSPWSDPVSHMST